MGQLKDMGSVHRPDWAYRPLSLSLFSARSSILGTCSRICGSHGTCPGWSRIYVTNNTYFSWSKPCTACSTCAIGPRGGAVCDAVLDRLEWMPRVIQIPELALYAAHAPGAAGACCKGQLRLRGSTKGPGNGAFQARSRFLAASLILLIYQIEGLRHFKSLFGYIFLQIFLLICGTILLSLPP